MSVGGKSAFGIANISKLKEVCHEFDVRVRIVSEPTDDNPSHALIRRLPADDLDLFDAIAADAFVEVVHNASVS